MSTTGSDTRTAEEFAAAYTALPKAEQARLLRAAQILAFKTDMGPDDLLSEAVLRTLEGERSCPTKLPLTTYLYGAMRSIASSCRKSRALRGTVVSLEVAAEAGLQIPNRNRTAEESMVAEDDCDERVEALQALFANDEPALLVVMGDLDEVPAEELRTMLDLDARRFATVRRRIRRKLADVYPNGWTT